MRVLLAFDKFKDAAGAEALCRVGEESLWGVDPALEIKSLPLTDGGEGFASLLTQPTGGQLRTAQVTGPRGEIREAVWGVVPAERIPKAARGLLFEGRTPGRLGVVEMAQAAGLEQVPLPERNPFLTTTYGVGELMEKAAAEVDLILLGLGGSATNDLGVGALAALGLQAHSLPNDATLPPWIFPKNWPLSAEDLIWNSRVRSLPIVAACDVDNPLFGSRGATRAFGPQKGLREEESLATMETLCQEMAHLLENLSGEDRSKREEPGSGAAGGISWGLGNFLPLRRVSGAELVASWQEWERWTSWADIVVTGEGCVDEGFFEGKGPGAIARKAIKNGAKVKVVAGKVKDGVGEHPLAREWRLEFFGLNPSGEPLEESLPQTLARLSGVLRSCLER